MRRSSKYLAIALSALFAATSVAPVSAMPLSAATTAQPAGGGTDIQLVDSRRCLYCKSRARGIFHDQTHWFGDSKPSGNGFGRSYQERRIHHDRRGWYRGHRGYRHARHGYRYHDGFWFPLAAFGAGAVIGGAIANDRGYQGGSSAHVNWCANRYRSYRAYDNTFQPYNGPRRQCVSPYG